MLNAAKNAFRAMPVANYFYPPTRVAVIEPPLPQFLDRMGLSDEVVYGLFLESEMHVAVASSLGKESLTAELWIQGAKRYAVTRQNPFEFEANSILPEEQIRTRLIHDARRVVMSDWLSIGGTALGGLIEHWKIDAVWPLASKLTEFSGWVGFEMATTIMYEYKKNDPTST